jgi:hypothetical protein
MVRRLVVSRFACTTITASRGVFVMLEKPATEFSLSDPLLNFVASSLEGKAE